MEQLAEQTSCYYEFEMLISLIKENVKMNIEFLGLRSITSPAIFGHLLWLLLVIGGVSRPVDERFHTVKRVR